MNLGQDEFERCWLKPYSQPMIGMESLVRELAKQYKLVLLSNVDKYYWNTLHQTLKELRYFDHFILSWQKGVAKPEHTMFELAIEVSCYPSSEV